jgi:nucleoside-diphosphate-sugar epimerase
LKRRALQAADGRVRRVLVTGGAGFLGQALARELAASRIVLAHRIELIAYDLVDAPGITTIRGDVLDSVALRSALERIDAVIHCAAVVDWSDLHADRMEAVNVRGTQLLLDACVASRVPAFVHTSTLDVLCGEGDVLRASESAPYPRRFLDAYGRTKAESERRVRSAPPTLATAILRFSAMYGQGDPYKVPSLVSEARAGRLLFRIGDGRAHMQPLFVGNAAAATLLALDRLLANDEDAKGKTFFIADHPAGNFFDWMAPIMAGLGYPLPSRRLPRWLAHLMGTGGEWLARHFGGRPALTRSSVRALCETITVDDSQARKVLGYEPPYSYAEAVALTVSWFNERMGLGNDCP